jgi:glutamate-1-semialdehyde aminotransferase
MHTRLQVMTGFRIAKGCAQEHFGITPDLTTMGKVRGPGNTCSCAVSASCMCQGGFKNSSPISVWSSPNSAGDTQDT